MEVAVEKYKTLKFIQFENVSSWSSYALLGKNLIYTQKYSFVRIGDFLIRNKEQVLIQDDILYKRPTISINGRGIKLRDEVLGKDIGTKNQFRLYKNQFLLSKIDARNGAFGVVPEALDNGIITGNFWTFDVEYSKINPHYLQLLTGTKEFQKLCQTASVGTTNRNYLQEDLFLNFEIPLPTLTEQQQIVDAYTTKIQQAQALQAQANNLEDEIEKYFLEQLGIEKEKKVKHSSLLKFIEYIDFDRWDGKSEKEFSSIYNIERIGKYITEISTGTTPPTGREEYFNGEINFYAPSDLGKEMYLNEAERKVTDLAIKDKKARKFEKETLLFVGIGSTVGKIGIVSNEYATSNQQITGFKVDNANLLNEFVYYYFNLCKHITVKEQTKATIPIVNQDKIVNIQIPVPPINVQKRISDAIKSMQKDMAFNNLQSTKLISEAQQEFEQSIFN